MRASLKIGLFVGLVVVMAALTAVTTATPPDTLIYSTYLGAEAAEYGRAIATDAAGNIYIAGETQSTTFPGSHAPLHGIDVYVARFNAFTGAADYILWFNALTLFAEDYAYGLAVGPDGSAYVTGDTRSDDFCALFGPVPGFDPTYNGNGDAFVLKIKPDGRGLDYCTFIGGSEADAGRAIALDDSGNAYVAGGTWSETDFPVSPSAYDTTHNGLRDGFVIKLDPTGTAVGYATYLGGSGQEEGIAITTDEAGQTAVTGWTFSTDFPTTPLAYDHTHNGSADIFVAALDAAGANLVSATFLGANQDDRPTGIARDDAGNVVVTGYTASPAFPTTPGVADRQHDGPVEAIVTKFEGNGRALRYSTFLGGAAEDWSHGLYLDTTGNVYLTGRTWSADFPTTANAFSATLNGGRDGFIAALNQDGTRLIYSSYLGGSDWDESLALTARDRQLYVTGATRSLDFPTTPNAYNANLNGDYDIFVLQTALPVRDNLYLPLITR